VLFGKQAILLKIHDLSQIIQLSFDLNQSLLSLDSENISIHWRILQWTLCSCSLPNIGLSIFQRPDWL